MKTLFRTLLITLSISTSIAQENDLPEFTGELHIIPTEGLPIITNWNLIWLKNKKLSFIAESFLEYIKKNNDSIIEDNFKWIDQY